MARHGGGTRVKAGFYWRPAHWETVTISGEGGVLPGAPEERFYRVPVLAMLLLAPIMGGLFVVFLPVIGFGVLLQHLGRKAYAASHEAALQLGTVFAPSWRPGEAHFAGKHGEKPAEEEPGEAKAAGDAKLDALAEEVEAKRKDA